MARRKKKGLTTKDYLLFGGIALFAYLLTKRGQPSSTTQSPMPSPNGGSTPTGGSTTGGSTTTGGGTTSSFNIQYWMSQWNQASADCEYTWLGYDCTLRNNALEGIYDTLNDNELQQLSNAVFQSTGKRMYYYLGLWKIAGGLSQKSQLLFNYCQANGF
jgi:hypothetical protein